MEELPIKENIPNKKWSYVYAYNLKILRDIFVYCVQKGEIKEKDLYTDMAKNIIPPPKTKWIGKGVKREERLRLEYIHAAEYLGFIKREQGVITPDFDNFAVEKKAVIRSNKNRVFRTSNNTTALTESEEWALANIVFDYSRAKDYLFWFLDFKKFKDSKKFRLADLKKYGKPIFLLGKTIIKKKGSDTIKRGADGKLWKIPDSYIRLANSLFPSWFIELRIINKVSVFPEFSEDKRLWHMFYPIKVSDKDFLNQDMGKLLEETFLKDSNKKSIWLPYLIYMVALKYGCSVTAIKRTLEKVYKEDYEHYYLERTSLSLMKRHSQYEDSYIKVDGFFRSSLVLTKKSNKNG